MGGAHNPDHIWSKMWRVGPKGVRVKVVQGRPLASLAPKLNVFARLKYNKHNYAVYRAHNVFLFHMYYK